MRVLVTGAGGFVGRAVLDILVRRKDVDVVVLGRRPINLQDVGWIELDLLDVPKLAAALKRSGATHLIHLAWSTEPGAFWTDPANSAWAAASGALMDTFYEMGGQRALGVGTCAEYAWDGAAQLTEDGPTRPMTLYGAAKSQALRLGEAAAARHGCSFTWGRLFWLFGPAEKPGRFVSDLCHALASGQEARVLHGALKRDYLHVADAAEALVAALRSDIEGPFNVGAGEAVRLGRMARLLGEIADRRELVSIDPPSQPPGPLALYADTSRLQEATGFRPRPLRVGLEETYRWWRSQPG